MSVKLFHENLHLTYLKQWCSKTTKLQDQDQNHLIFQDQDRSGQDHFFKTKTAFFKIIKLLTQNTGLAKKFDWEGPKLEKFLWRHFGDVSWWRNGDAVTKMTS